MAADTVTSNVIFQDAYQYVIHLTGLAQDGAGESNVIKVDKSTLVSSAGIEPVAMDIERVDFAVVTFTSVKISWDHATDSPGLLLLGSGSFDFTGLPRGAKGGILRNAVRTSGLQDPQVTTTGDVFLTSSATAGGVYAITLWLNKRT